jgi:iron complex transport system substrate-binding protein
MTRRAEKPGVSLRTCHCLLAALFLSLCANGLVHAAMLMDQAGRWVAVPGHPQRVVALAPNITEIVFSIGRGGLLCGATTYSNFPAAAARLPKVGSYVHLDLERIVALRPDLCIAIKDGNPRSVVDRLEALGIPVYAVRPRNLDGVMATVTELGGLLGAQDEAARLVASMESCVESLKEAVGRTDLRPRVFFQIGISPIVSVGTDTLIHQLITLAGGRNCAEGPLPYPRLDWENVLSMQPDVVIITSMERDRAHNEAVHEWYRWQAVPAVRDRRVHLVDSDLFDRPSPRLVGALTVLARLIHPELDIKECPLSVPAACPASY